MTLIRISPSVGVGIGRWIKAIGLPTVSTARAFMVAISVVNGGKLVGDKSCEIKLEEEEEVA